MSGSLLLDNNIIIPLLANDPHVVRQVQERESIFIPCIVAGELYYGAYNSGRVEENLSRLEPFFKASRLLDVNVETARVYSEIKGRLKQKGRPIPENDLWIAALAIQYDMTLIPRDAHFEEVEGLKVEKW